MVLAAVVLVPTALAGFAAMRLTDVAVGTLACVTISAVFAIAAGTHVLLLLTGHVPLLWWLVLAAGIWLGHYLRGSTLGIGYIGTQFCLGYLTAFVHDVHLAHGYAAARPHSRWSAGVRHGLSLGAVLTAPKRPDS